MRTVLLLGHHPDFFNAVKAVFDVEKYRVIHRLDVAEAEPLLNPSLVDACILDEEGSQTHSLWAIEKIRRTLKSCPLLIFTTQPAWELEEEAYLQGATYVLTKPLRPRLLNSLLDRLLASAPVSRHLPPARPRPPAPLPAGPPHDSAPAPRPPLEVLRDFSGILTYSLESNALLKKFLDHLRAILGVNRAAIFLRRPDHTFGSREKNSGSPLKSACAVGLPAELLLHFELSFESGIGGHLYRSGKILRNDSPEALDDPTIQTEFQLLGAQVAVPILDRENLLGVAVFDGRVTGESLASAELQLIFHLLEELGLAIKNIWLHEQLSANHGMLAHILSQLSSACVLVHRSLRVLHANQAALKLFSRSGRRGSPLEFSDLPQFLGGKVYQVLKTGGALAPFRQEMSDPRPAVYQVTILPFQESSTHQPESALLVIEDLTQSEQLKSLEMEAGQLRLVRRMADRLAHEIGNAMVPLSTHHQLLEERYSDAEFRDSLNLALGESTKRVTRFVNQMRYLAREDVLAQEAFPLLELVEEAFREANTHQTVKSARLKYEDEKQPFILRGERAALKHAFAEVMLNALQANSKDAAIGVTFQAKHTQNGADLIQVDIRDNGLGFTEEALKRVPTPFYTTKTVGLGLGLSVCQKILELHKGALQIVPPDKGQNSLVRIILPLSKPDSESSGQSSRKN